MPCNDVTEVIRLTVDANDHLVSYRFIKRTCGQGVGADALLEDEFVGQSIEALLAIDPAAFLHDHPVEESIEEFLLLKHLIAVQATIAVFVGDAACGPDAICAAAMISYEDEKTTIDARISVDLVTERISSCGGCSGCGKTAAVREVVEYA